MNHNELVGWHTHQEHLAVLMLYGNTTYPRTALQQHLAQALLQTQAAVFIPLHAKGHTPWEQSLYLIHIGDWISYYLAQEKGVDPTATAVIEHLKAGLKRNT